MWVVWCHMGVLFHCGAEQVPLSDTELSSHWKIETNSRAKLDQLVWSLGLIWHSELGWMLIGEVGIFPCWFCAKFKITQATCSGSKKWTDHVITRAFFFSRIVGAFPFDGKHVKYKSESMIATNSCLNMFNQENKCLERCGSSVRTD